VAEIEVCASVFDLGDDELLDRIEAELTESESAVLPLNYPPQRPQRDACEAHLADLMRAYPEGPP